MSEDFLLQIARRWFPDCTKAEMDAEGVLWAAHEELSYTLAVDGEAQEITITFWKEVPVTFQ